MPRSTDASYPELEVRIQKRDRRGYPVELTLDDTRELAQGSLKANFLPWVPGDDPAADGERLFNWLFGTHDLKVAWGIASGVDRQCRLRLRIDDSAPELHTVPWELLRQPASGRTPALDLAADSKTPFSRYLALPAAPGRPIVAERLKVLVAVADPANLADYGLVAIDPEQEMVALRAATADLPVDLVPLDGPCTLAALEVALRRGCHVLHFIGHGTYHKELGAALYLADKNNQVQRTGAKDLVDMVGHQFTKESPLRLIFLASCQTATTSTADAFRGLAPQLLQVGVPAVLAMQGRVPIPTARKFGQAFYGQLLVHGLVDRAANEARASVLAARLPGAAVPVLFMRVPDGWLIEPPQGDARLIIETERYEPETVLIPGGSCQMGTNDPAAPPEERPQHSVDLPDFRIGKYPVTNEQYLAFVRECRVSVAPEVGWQLADVGKEPPPNKLDHPVVGVTWDDAVAYCRWLREKTGHQYRLPSEAEWEKAASWEVESKSTRVYPWGNEWMDGHCNVVGSDTTPVSAHEVGASPYGVQDMLGNIWEWTSTRWGIERRRPQFSYPYDSDDDRENMAADEPYREFRVLRGGSYREQAAQITCTTRSRAAADHRQSRRGFRVAMTTQ